MEKYENRGPVRLWAEGLAGELISMGRAPMPLPAKRFCIFGQGRTGSTLLTTLLDSHPDIRCEDEILRRPRLMPLRYLDRASRGRLPAFGFHLKPYHLTRFQRVTDVGAFLRALHEDGWRFVHLIRRDGIAHVFSTFYARHHGWHRRSDASPDPVPLIEIDAERFVRKLQKRRNWLAREREALSGLEAFPISYEDDLLHAGPREEKVGAFLDWLGLPHAPLKTPLKKSVRGSPWDLMANPDEVHAALCRAGLDAG